jgi:tetratricopeptide (TPR) repeat protein
MQRSFVSIVVLSALVAFRPCPAAAGDKEQAKRLFDSGVKLMQLEDFGAATADLERSVALYPTQNSLFNLANCYKGLQRYADALEVLARLRRDFGDKLKPEIKVAAERHEQEIQALVARLTIKTAPDDTSVNLDGRDLGAGPLLGPLCSRRATTSWKPRAWAIAACSDPCAWFRGKAVPRSCTLYPSQALSSCAPTSPAPPCWWTVKKQARRRWLVPFRCRPATT